MWMNEKNFPARGFSTPQPTRKTRLEPQSPLSQRKHRSPSSCKPDLFHVMHKVPAGDSPYVRAKHVQLVDKEPSKAISLFWAAINSGDRVDSALKDMAVVMKQLNRSEEAIEAIKSFRHLCPRESQDSLDNLLLELYKRSGRIEEEIEMLHHKLKCIEDNMASSGRRTKTARSQGKRIQITVEQERSRILGNLAWAYLQQYNYETAEELYRKALAFEPDNNKQCNLAICLMHMNRIREAKSLLQSIRPSCKEGHLDDSFTKSFERAFQMLSELELSSVPTSSELGEDHYQNQRSFTLPITRNSKETTTFTSQCQDYNCCYVVSGSSPDRNGKGAQLFNDQNKVSHCHNYHENKDTFSGRDEGNSKYISFGTVSVPYSSPQASFYNEWKEGGAGSRNSFGRRPDFSSRRKENCIGMTGTSIGSSQKKGYISPSPARAIPTIPLTQPRRRGFWGHDAVGASSHKTSFEHGEAQSMPKESRRVVGKERMEAFVGEDGEYRLDATLSGSMAVKDVEKECLGKNNFGLHQPVSENPMPNHCRRKSWADMVEEEEHEFLSRRMDNVDHKCFDGQGSREGFYDENLNSNIFCPPNQMENLGKKLDSFDLKNYSIKSGNAISSRNSTVRRSLCFDQQQNPDPVEYCCSSPLPKKALDFEDGSFAPADGTKEFSLEKYITPMRRNRLQVFQNITRVSP